MYRPLWQEYNAEMAHNYKLLQEEASKPDRDLSKLTELVLHMAFYWYNFMPLSRGTAAVGTFTPHHSCCMYLTHTTIDA